MAKVEIQNKKKSDTAVSNTVKVCSGRLSMVGH